MCVVASQLSETDDVASGAGSGDLVNPDELMRVNLRGGDSKIQTTRLGNPLESRRP